jgi:CspA family cold shock protein
MTGSVKTMNEKGFGFITPDDGGKDLFFHQTGLVGVNFDELKPGDKVSFDSEESEKGPRATNVQRA